MQSLPSSFGSSLSAALNELLGDVDQIRNIIANPKWKNVLSKSGEKNEVLLSRLVFDLLQANDHIVKTREQLAEIMAPEKQQELI
jgi:hypothetical protein